MEKHNDQRTAYSLALQRMEHEHSLENLRINWFLVFEGFLFSAINTNAIHPCFCQYVIPIVGILVALATLLGVVSAQGARTALKDWYDSHAKENGYPKIGSKECPHPPFRPSHRAGQCGRATSWVLPLVIIAGWISVILFCNPSGKISYDHTPPNKEEPGSKKNP